MIGNFKRIGATSHEAYVRWNLCEVDLCDALEPRRRLQALEDLTRLGQ